jgi:TP901 family phage tail tape measure protein
MAQTERKIEIEIRAKTEKALSEINRLTKELNQLKKTEKNFKAMDSQVKQMSRSFASLATHIGKLAVIYGAFEGLNTTVRTFAEFESSMTRLGVISGATAGELAKLNDKAMQLGESTIYSASQVADGMNAMAMAGLNTEQTLTGIGSVLDLASIGMIGLEDATLIAVRTMGSFGLEAKDIAHITDIMATGATDSAQTISELGNAYEKVGSVAKAFGISLEETTASLELMADAGRKGSEAGTQLKIVMSRLAGNKEAKKYIDQLGISMYDTNGKLLPFKQQLVLLKRELDKLPDSARNIKLSEIFGEEGKATALVLLNNLDKFDNKLKNLKNSFGSASEKAKALQDDLKGSFKELKSALEGLAIKIGTNLTPVLRDMIDDATIFIRTLSKDDIDKFSNQVADLLKFLGELGTLFVEVTGFLASLARGFTDITGISAGWVVVVGGMVYKLRKLIPIVASFGKNLLTVNPYLLAFTAGLIAIDVALASMRAEINRTNEETKNFTDTFKSLYDLIDGTMAGLEFMDAEGIRTTLKAIADDTKRTKREIASLKEELANEEDKYFFMRDDEKILALKNKINLLERNLKTASLATEELKKRGNELDAVLKKEAESTGKLADKLDVLEEAQQKSLDKSKKWLDGRVKSLETTLGTMTEKETRYHNKLAELEAKTAEIRKKYANERLALDIDNSNKIANVWAKGLSEYGKYKDAQKRADEAYLKAKEYLEKGNLDIAKKYLDEYNNLIAISAGEEITEKEKVWKYNSSIHKFERKEIERTRVSKHQTALEYEQDVQRGGELTKMYLKQKEQLEIDANNREIQAQKLKIEMLQAQMSLQKQMLQLINELVVQAGGVKIQADFTQFDTAMQHAKEQLSSLEGEQRKIKIDGADTTGVDRDLQKLDNEEVNPTVKPVVDEKPFKKFEKTVVTTEMITQVNADLTKANAEVARLEAEVAKQGTKPVDANTSSALRKAYQLQAELSKRVDKYVYVHTIQARNSGGEIQKFATGGTPALENGKGHSRKSGKLSGYGGGDRVKALLEAGEFIVRKEAVRKLGLDRLYQINQGHLPRYQTGGEVGKLQRFSTGGSVNTDRTSSGKTVELNLNIGNNSYKTFTDEDIATSLAEYLQRSTF